MPLELGESARSLLSKEARRTTSQVVRRYVAEPGSQGKRGHWEEVPSRLGSGQGGEEFVDQIVAGLLRTPVNYSEGVSGYGDFMVRQARQKNLEEEALTAATKAESDYEDYRNPHQETDQRPDKEPIQDPHDNEELFGPEGIGRKGALEDMPSEGRDWDVRRHGEEPPVPVAQQDLTDLDEGFSLGRNVKDEEKFQRRVVKGGRVVYEDQDDLTAGLDTRVARLQCPSCNYVDDYLVAEAGVDCTKCNWRWLPDEREAAGKAQEGESTGQFDSEDDQGNTDPKHQQRSQQGNSPRERTNYGEDKGTGPDRLIEAAVIRMGNVELREVRPGVWEHRSLRTGGRVYTDVSKMACSCGGNSQNRCYHLNAVL